MKKVVVIGGGTGTFTLLSGLKKLPLELTAIVTMADNGGSTGRLRDEFGYLPVGDLRMALVALSDSNGDDILRDLFLYRFEKGQGLQGHNFGNLLITALSDILKSEEKAFEYASKILRVKGRVYPITKQDVTLIAHYENGQIIIGESNIDEPNPKHDGTARITHLKLQPKAQIAENAKKAIEDADLIILGPGDLYTSTLANLVVTGVSKAIKNSRGNIAYIINLINKYGQTYNFKASDYVSVITKYLKKTPDYILVNNSPLPKQILKKYSQEQGFPVKDDLKTIDDAKVIHGDYVAKKAIKRHSGDILKRSLIRHDPTKVANAIANILDL